ncbi:hypothetical protein F5Y08DRAFT_211691 [Xylaria arbuscula]|nr:hypothetical protein F5Y08DRAFT_211691 [Xylaria arbuscula]
MDAAPSDVTSLAGRIRPTPWRRACVGCTRAKRQCTKQVPRCRRCVEKGLHCAYLPPRRPEICATAGDEGPPFRTNNTTLQFDGDLIAASGIPAPFGVSGNSRFDPFQMTAAGLETFGLSTEDDSSRGSQSTIPSDTQVSLQGAWFLAPETWTAEFTDPPPTIRETEKSLKHYIEQVQLWTRQWVTEGHSPLHHRELYSFHMPRHTQDAYTAMAAYMGKTQANEATVRQILEDRVSQLLQDQAVEASLGTDTAATSSSGDEMTIFAHLSRVQSLLCYQLIRLYDGDIRMRGQAEALVPTLYLWNRQMLESAKDSLTRPERFLTSSPFGVNCGSFGDAMPLPAQKAVWHAWIVAESVRRTWQAATVVQEVYLFLKRGWSECPGRVPSTMRKALWDAPSAYSWASELGGGQNPLLVSMAKLEELLPQITPAELDDFNIACIGLYGMERMDRWLEDKDRYQPPLLSGLENMSYGL